MTRRTITFSCIIDSTVQFYESHCVALCYSLHIIHTLFPFSIVCHTSSTRFIAAMVMTIIAKNNKSYYEFLKIIGMRQYQLPQSKNEIYIECFITNARKRGMMRR